VFLRSLARLRNQLLALRPRQVSESTWGDYEGECAHYSSAERERKHSFVREAIERTRPARVLDLGANAGEYSRIAAAGGARHVVAADADINALQALYRRNETERLPITPFVLNLARPTPAVGWRNVEHPSFLDRARGRFDTVLALAVMHHMLVSERVPLEDFIAFLADLEPRHLVLEWVSPQDEKFRQIAGANLGLYSDLDEARLRQALSRRFRVISEAPIGEGRRRLFLAELQRAA
jgi:SAM-dependent methyltransferase